MQWTTSKYKCINVSNLLWLFGEWYCVFFRRNLRQQNPTSHNDLLLENFYISHKGDIHSGNTPRETPAIDNGRICLILEKHLQYIIRMIFTVCVCALFYFSRVRHRYCSACLSGTNANCVSARTHYLYGVPTQFALDSVLISKSINCTYNQTTTATLKPRTAFICME